MLKVCKHSKLEFEGLKWVREHPLISCLKTLASLNSDHQFNQVLDALDEAFEIGGYETIEGYLMIVQKVLARELENKILG